jgi:hypothetical protein
LSLVFGEPFWCLSTVHALREQIVFLATQSKFYKYQPPPLRPPIQMGKLDTEESVS